VATRPPTGWPATTFLAQLSDATRQAVLQLGTRRRLSAGEIVIHEGDHSDFVVVLLSGLYKVVGHTDDGREALLAVRVGGDIVGELGVTDGQPRSATVRAAGGGECLRIGERSYRAFLRDNPDAAEVVSRAMAGKLRSATRRRVEFATCPTPVRVARVLQELAGAHGVRGEQGILVGVTLTQPELAALVGATEATVQRVLTAMRDEEIVRTGYRRVHILDEARLAELARR
jgi:CRP/FNR family transcriptional regulator, cyclic AMP receptor protein